MSGGRELPIWFSTWQQEEKQFHTPPSEYKKMWGLSVLLYNVTFSLLTIVTSNQLQPLQRMQRYPAFPSPVQPVMTDPGAFLQIKQPLSHFPSAPPVICSGRSITFTGTVQQTAMRRQKKVSALHAHSPFKLRRSTQKCTPLPKEGRIQQTGTGLHTHSVPCKLRLLLCKRRKGYSGYRLLTRQRRKMSHKSKRLTL